MLELDFRKQNLTQNFSSEVFSICRTGFNSFVFKYFRNLKTFSRFYRFLIIFTHSDSKFQVCGDEANFHRIFSITSITFRKPKFIQKFKNPQNFLRNMIPKYKNRNSDFFHRSDRIFFDFLKPLKLR
jgi:hypothetical protein